MARAVPIVSVVMACLNSARHIAASVASVRQQTLEDWEMIVVDNGSTDDTVGIVENFRDARIRVLHQPVRGVSAARNMAIADARAPYIAFLDSDDTWHPECLKIVQAALAARPDAALAYCGWQNVGASWKGTDPYIPPELDGVARPEELLASCPWPIHAAITRTQAIRATNGFELSLAVGEDFLLWLEIACFHPIVRVPQVLAYYHHHGAGQATEKALRAALQAYAAQQLFLQRHPSLIGRLGRPKVRELTLGRLLKRGYESYWRGDIDTARGIFRRVIRAGYGRPIDWTYMLPSLLPRSMHQHAVNVMRSRRTARP